MSEQLQPVIDVHHQTLFRLPGFRPQKFAVAIHAAPVAVDESHRVAAHGTLGRRSFGEDREFRQFEIVVVGHAVVLPLLARFHFEQ